MITPKLTLPEAAPSADREAASKKYVDDNRASPITINMLTTAPSAVGQGTWAASFNSSFLYSGVFDNSATQQDGDNFSVSFACVSGAYSIQINLAKASNRSIVDVFLDETKIIDALDLYNSTPVVNFITSVSGINITSGTHVLRFAVKGKNVNSSAFSFLVQGISLTRTGDIV
jgi:hypothetical protein